MKYQATHCKDPAQKDLFTDAMKDDDKATQAVAAFFAENSEDCARKKLINWAEWNQTFGKRTSKEDHSVTKPFEKTEWMLREDTNNTESFTYCLCKLCICIWFFVIACCWPCLRPDRDLCVYCWRRASIEKAAVPRDFTSAFL
jgi:hypothetical protein